MGGKDQQKKNAEHCNRYLKINVKKMFTLVYQIYFICCIFFGGESDYIFTIEYAEYAKSDAPKLTPSNTKAKALIGWVPATNWKDKIKLMANFFIVSWRIV